MSKILRLLACNAKDTRILFAQTELNMRERVKEFGMDELWYKDTICLYDQMDVGTSFVRRL